MSLHIAIIGYGIAGMAAAACMRRLGHSVTHFERGMAPRPGGGGLLLWPGSLRALASLGADMEAIGAPVRRVVHRDGAGRHLMTLDLVGDRDHGPDGPSVVAPPLGVPRSALFDAISRAEGCAAMLQPLGTVRTVDAHHGTLIDDEGRQIGPFDLVIGADGANSSLRRRLDLGIIRHRRYRSAAVVCTVEMPLDDRRDAMELHFAGTAHLAAWPVGRAVPSGPRLLNISVNAPVDHLAAMLDPGNWRRHVIALDPRLAPASEQLADRGRLLAYSYNDVQLQRYHCGRFVLIGDAAHAMSPQLGQGVAFALEDAIALGDCLLHDRSVQHALEAFDARRRPRIAAYQRLSRWVTPAFQGESRTLAWLRDVALRATGRSSTLRRALVRRLSGSHRSRAHPP